MTEEISSEIVEDGPPRPEVRAVEPDPLFNRSRFRFQPGKRSGETARISSGEGEVLLTYRGFASVVTIVAALVAGIVLLTGIAATIFLLAEHRAGAAAAVIILSAGFAGFIAALVPRTRLTLFHGEEPVLIITQQSRVAFPQVRFAIKTAEGVTLATLGRTIFSRLGRNRWSIDTPPPGRPAFAIEESLSRAVVRKVAGKFHRSQEANIRIVQEGVECGLIVRRPDRNGQADYLEISSGERLDRRVAVALATLIFGAEP